ncbi:FATC domain-containing protein, partial [Cardiosporidium cionae]
HLENILVHRSTGSIVHVDFDCLFGKGFELEIPEIVPFRLTQNFVVAMGLTGVEGSFRVTCINTMRVLRHHKDMLLSVLMSFVHDPLIEWTKGNGCLGEEKARKSIVEISQKLNGMVNVGALTLPSDAPSLPAEKLRNALFIPNKEIRHINLAIETQVDELIRASMCPRNLSQMYVGWMPWI